MTIFKHYYTQYKTIGITDEIEWKEFTDGDKDLLQPFVAGRMRLMILRLYKNKVNAKVTKVLRKPKNNEN